MGELADAREDSFDILLELLESALANSDYSQSEIESLIDISKDDLYSMTLPHTNNLLSLWKSLN
jgi:hypothetical protein